MSKFTLIVEMDNAAFVGEGRRVEIPRILYSAAERYKVGENQGRCMDSDGNTVGFWSVNG